MSRTLVSRTTVAAALAALAVGGSLVVTHSPAGASASTAAGSSPAAAGWAAVLRANATTSGASAALGALGSASPNITSGERISLWSRPLRGGNVDTGARGDTPGDYFVFEERLENRAGERIGDESARCMLIVRSFRCDVTFALHGRGTIEVSQTLFSPGWNVLAVTGGTGEFRNVRGQALIAEENPERTHFVFHLLP